MAETDDTHRPEGEEPRAIPLVAETVRIGKRLRTTGKVRVKVQVETDRRKITEELLGEEIEIERVSRNEPVDTVPQVRTEGGVTVIPVVEEQLFVEKRLVLVEEIRLRRLPTRETVEVPVEVRTERAVVERVAPEPEEEPPSRS